MDAKKLFEDKDNTFIYLERYVNDGSPSGFTDIHTTSDQTNPFIGADRFPLLEFDDTDNSSIKLGNTNDLFELGINYAHPDSSKSLNLKSANRDIFQSKLLGSPTASARTILLRSTGKEGFLKLTYDVARIGRVDRQLSLKICQASMEVTDALKQKIDEGKIPKTFGILRDVASKVSILDMGNTKYEWGTIYREREPYPYTTENRQLIPGFSLFSIDRHNPSDEVLINQLIDLSNSNPKDYLINLSKMIVDSYWNITLSCAFHIEAHGQNCLFEVDEKYNIVRFIYRDMDSVDKDIPLAKHFGLKHDWDCYPYLCLDESIYYYPIRSSYMYDFKLGQYLLSPIIDVVTQKYDLDPINIQNEIKDYVQSNYINMLPSTYFPKDGCWYDCDNTERLPGKRRKYYAHINPKFR